LADNNVKSSIVTLATIDRRFHSHRMVVFEHLLILPVCFGIRSSADACVFGYGLVLVGRLSSYQEIAREAREFVPWTVKTFDHRG
jgi:hypothetical protein